MQVQDRETEAQVATADERGIPADHLALIRAAYASRRHMVERFGYQLETLLIQQAAVARYGEMLKTQQEQIAAIRPENVAHYAEYMESVERTREHAAQAQKQLDQTHQAFLQNYADQFRLEVKL